MKIVRFIHKHSVFSGYLNDEGILYEHNGKVEKVSPEEVRLLPPVIPSKIVAVGLNYKDHADELGMKIPDEPLIFLKPPSSIIGHGDAIVYPSCTERVDYEAELAVIISKECKGIKAVDARKYILGYSCFNDVTSRDIQKKDGQWSRAKSFDTFAPVGPWVETEMDPDGIEVRSYLNGDIKQDSSTAGFIFRVPELVEFVSSIMTLVPGDVIATGTPPGVGPVSIGDEVSIEIGKIGRLTNIVTTGNGGSK